MRETVDHVLSQNLEREYLLDQVHHVLQKILPDAQFPPIERSFPIVKFSSCDTPPFPLSIYILSPYRLDAGKFFYEMVSGWLIPGRKINIELFFVTDFKFSPMEKEVYTIAEAVVRIKDDRDYRTIQRTMEAFQRELSFGLSSIYHANRILEIKGLSLDQKTALVREDIVRILGRFPHRIDYDIFSFLQQFIVNSSRQFRECHSHRSLTKIICTLYAYFHSIRNLVEQSGGKRYLYSKSVKVPTETPFGEKSVVGVFVALNFLHRHEVFEKSYLLKAAQRYVKDVRIVEGSYFSYQPTGDKILTFYVEIEKEGGEGFTVEEVSLLQKRLLSHLNHCIEQLVRPVFIPRNEEEIMRYIVTLSRQVQYIKDIPQIVISFDGQLEGEVTFTVVLVRPVLSFTEPVDQILKKRTSAIRFDVERIKRIGFVRKKYPKEAVVLRVRMQESAFLKEDHSLNLYKARQRVVEEMEHLFGEIRDFNGGLLAKQMEVYGTLKEAVQEAGIAIPESLDNFFYSIYPVELRGIFPLSALVKLYLLFYEAVFSHEATFFRSKKEEHHLFVMIASQELQIKQAIMRKVEEFKIPPSHLIKLQMVHEGKNYLGYVFLSSNGLEMEVFLKALHSIIV